MAYFFGALIALMLWIFIDAYVSELFYNVAADKGYSDRKYYRICFWLGLPGWLLVCAMPDRGNAAPVISDELPDL